MYDAAFSACEKGRRWQRALKMFEEFSNQGIRANVITYSATISACEKEQAVTARRDLVRGDEQAGNPIDIGENLEVVP